MEDLEPLMHKMAERRYKLSLHLNQIRVVTWAVVKMMLF